MIVCKLCGKQFSTWFRFGLHLRLDHDMTTHAYYDKFFKKALSKTVEKLGIVYTPVEIVDFINQSVRDILKKELQKLGDKNKLKPEGRTYTPQDCGVCALG